MVCLLVLADAHFFCIPKGRRPAPAAALAEEKGFCAVGRAVVAASCKGGSYRGSDQAPESTVGQPYGSLLAGNIRRIFGGIFEMMCVEWYTSVDSRRQSTVELKSKAF